MNNCKNTQHIDIFSTFSICRKKGNSLFHDPRAGLSSVVWYHKISIRNWPVTELPWSGLRIFIRVYLRCSYHKQRDARVFVLSEVA